jgi:hypothetical protein
MRRQLIGSGRRCVRQGPRPVVVTHLQMRSSWCHPFLRHSARTGILSDACPDLRDELLEPDTKPWR